MECQYIPYPLAKRRLAERLGATAREIAGWIFMGPKDGGLNAFTNGNEFDDPPRFHFSLRYIDDPSYDYVRELSGTWFRASDIETFEPGCRFITSEYLIRRWSSDPEENAEDFIQARIDESMLLPIHPGGVGTPWDGDEDAAPREFALFFLEHVEAVEAEYGITPVLDATKSIKPVSKKAGRPIHPSYTDVIAVAAGVVREMDDSDIKHKSWHDIATDVLSVPGSEIKDSTPSTKTVSGWLKAAWEDGRLKAEVEKGGSTCPDLSALSRPGRRRKQ